MRKIFIPFLALLAQVGLAQQTDCPRIYKVNDTLKTDPAPTYQWYKNGVIIPNANNIWYKPTESGDYTVAVSGISTPKSVTLNPADLRVDVFDAKLKPVANATVSVNGQTTTTNADGRAFVPNVISERTVVKVTHNGYFDGYTATYNPASGDAIAKIQLEALGAAFTVNTQNGGGVASSTGLNIKFKPNAFINESTGQPYSGAVKVYFSHRSPEHDPMFSFAMPGGDFTAINQNGETVALTSYGFFNAELRGTNGEELNLKPGTTAEVQFRIPKNMRADAPATVPLWYFDEAAGIWKYDSELTKSGMFYKGQVSHFSSWNCDYYGPRCTVVASAIDCNGNPAASVSVCLNQRCGVTDANGNITFVNAPADLPITLYSQQDSINIGIVGEGNTYTLAEPLQAGESMLAFVEYWQDSVKVYTFGAEPLVLYSLDNQNWQTESLFTNVPFQDSVTVWIKDASACPPIQRVAYYTRERTPYFCNSPQNQDEINQYSFSFNNLPLGNIPVYEIYGCPVANNQLAYVCERYSCFAQLSLNGCDIAVLPAEIGNLSNLQELYLYDNQLTVLPAEIGNLSNLQEFDLFNNQLTVLPAEIGNLSNLQFLYLYENQLTALPAEIGNLSNLRTLGLYGNQLTALPAEIGNLSNLQTLNLNGNQLTTLPAEFWNLSNLQTLILNGNQLITLPAEVANLSNLQRLSLYGNQLTTLPAEVANLSNLRELDHSNNQLTALPAEIGNLSNLLFLYLGYNQLTALPAEIGNLSNLQTLHLDYNQLTSLPPQIGNLNNLVQLGLSSNQLINLPAEIGNLSKLQTLHLDYNQLTALPAEIANLADTLQYLYLQGNPIPVQDRPYYQNLLPNTLIVWQ